MEDADYGAPRGTHVTEELENIDPQERFQEFLKTERYRQRISQMAVAGTTSLRVDFEDLLAFDERLAEQLLEKPDDFLKTERYRQRISQMAVAGTTSLRVDFEDLLAFDERLAEQLLEKPDDYLKHANNAAYAQL